MKLFLNQINFADFAAVGVILGSFAQVLPPLAALAALVYYGFVIYDRIKYGPDLEGRKLWQRQHKDLTPPPE